LGWAVLFNTLAGNSTLLQLESATQGRLWRWRGPKPIAPDIAIVGIDGRIEGSDTADVPEFSLERANYAALALRLLEWGKAKVVVLNLPGSFVVPQTFGSEDLDAPLRQVVQDYADRIVLTARSSENVGRSELAVYNHFLPFSSLNLQYLVPPEQIEGFVQFRTDPLGILRQVQFSENFIRRDSRTVQAFDSVEFLAIAKAKPKLAETLQKLPRPLFFDPLGPADTLSTIPVEAICPPQIGNSCLGAEPTQTDLQARLRDKIVLVGFVGGVPESNPMRTSYGSPIAAVELQSQILSSLLRQDLYRPLPAWPTRGVVVLLSLSTGLLLAFGAGSTERRFRWGRLLQWSLAASLPVGYAAWGIANLWLWHWLWPLTLPVLSSTATAASVALTLSFLHNRDRLQSQQAELDALRQAEQEAVVYQARKLLYRVATDIHDKELQDLKLVMDDLEVQQWQNADLNVDGILDRLQEIGSGIRQQLNDARSLAGKMGISPTLREGLHRGMTAHLQELQAEGTLTIAVQAELPPLQEPNTSEWFDAREDILRFFREAIANVIHHVHPPKGSATFVRVRLSQVAQCCCLEVSNDGVEFNSKRQGGYGTKAMNTIAENLPAGRWERVRAEDGQMLVTLTWDMPPS
jgi:signal transduction histidine kinase